MKSKLQHEQQFSEKDFHLGLSSHPPNRPPLTHQPGDQAYPLEALDYAFSYLESDGSVVEIDSYDQQPFRREPHDPYPIEKWPHDRWLSEIRHVGKKIQHLSLIVGALTNLNNRHDHPNYNLYHQRYTNDITNTAHYLTLYWHDRQFLETAASLLPYNEGGLVGAPQLPEPVFKYHPLNLALRENYLKARSEAKH